MVSHTLRKKVQEGKKVVTGVVSLEKVHFVPKMCILAPQSSTEVYTGTSKVHTVSVPKW